jgi:hypothetical protein
MYFLQPLALLFLVAALIPPLLHLFQRRRPPDVPFPAVRYLRQTEREASRSIRLRHLLLLLLRVAAVALIALAAARPVVPKRIGVGHEPTALGLVLDNSLSSGAVAGGVRAFDDLAARGRETLRAARASDALWLIGSDGIARRGSPAELLGAVAALRPEPVRLDLSAAVATAAQLVRASGYARSEVHVLSDLQRTAFGEADSTAAGLPLLFYHPAADPPGNRAVVSARAAPATWVAAGGDVAGGARGMSGAVAVVIGGAPAPRGAKVAVGASVSGRAGTRSLVAPGDAVLLPATAPTTGWAAGEVSLEPDELRADDQRPFAVRVVTAATVAVAPRADLGRFVTEALGVLAGAGQIRLGRPPGVLLAEDAPSSGSAVVFPPHDPVELGAANRALAAAGVPWRYGALIEREDTLAAPQLREISGAVVRRRYRLDAVPDAGEGGPAHDILARAGGDPWLVRAGRVVVVGSRFVPEETALPLTGGFVPFLADLVNRIARGDEGILEAAPGDPVPLPEGVSALALGGDSLQPVVGGRAVAAPTSPGVYPLMAGEADTVGVLVVAPDPRESDLRRASAGELASLFPGARVAVASNAGTYGAERFHGAGRSELAGLLLLLALLVLVVEGIVAAGGVRRSAEG